MILRTPRSTRTDTPFPYTTLFRSLGGLGGGAGANLLLDAATDVGIDILPIGERLAQDRLADAAQKAAGDLIDQLRPLRIVEDIAHQNTRLAEIIVVGARRIGAAHHVAVGLPSVRNRPDRQSVV